MSTSATPKRLTKLVTLRLPSDKLSVFGKSSSSSSSSSSSPSSSTPALLKGKSKVKAGTGSSASAAESDSPAVKTPHEHNSELNVSPALVEAAGLGKKRKSTGEPKILSESKKVEDNTTPKPRGKPGPKRRKLDGEAGSERPGAGVAPAAHKLGPKANQGAINAGLRALDRTGKPSRRWHRRGFMLKSFTGFHWALPCWETPKLNNNDTFNGEDKSGTPSSSDVNRPEPPSSAVGSDKSINGATLASSPPAPTPAADIAIRV